MTAITAADYVIEYVFGNMVRFEPQPDGMIKAYLLLDHSELKGLGFGQKQATHYLAEKLVETLIDLKNLETK